MLQRIQTVFWIIAIAFLSYFVFLNYSNPSEILYLGMGGIAIILNFIIIFLFRNRKLQIALTYLSNLLVLAIFGLLLWSNTTQPSLPNTVVSICLFGAVISNLLAIFYTRKDIKLIEGSTRLR